MRECVNRMNKGFTLIEVLSVLIVLAVLAMITVPVVNNVINSTKEKSKRISAENYIDAVEKIWNYTKEYLIDGRDGSEWLSEVDENGIPFTRKPIVEPWKCPYHNGRMCLEVIKRAKQ